MRKPTLVEIALMMAIMAMIYQGFTIIRLSAEIGQLKRATAPILDGMDIPGRSESLFNGIHYDQKAQIVYCATPCGGHIYKIPSAEVR